MTIGQGFTAFVFCSFIVIIIQRNYNAKFVVSVRNCQSNVCLNGGSCQVDDNTRSFQCICLKHFTGILCEKETENDCHLKCQNGEKCINENGNERCECQTGHSCETALLDCQVQGCSNNQRCVTSKNGTSICVSNPCLSNPCKHNSSCIPKDDGFECKCSAGYAGQTCSDDLDECALYPCQNGGTCINNLGSFACLCMPGFYGERCEYNHVCSQNPCANGATCEMHGDSYKCICPAGFTSDLCDEEVNEECHCKSSKQVCVKGVCKCPEGYMGKDCDQPVPWSCVTSNGCESGGTCVKSTGICLCPQGRTGMRCEIQLECAVDGLTCAFGTCVWGNAGAYCDCKYGYTGKYCEAQIEQVDLCANRDCNDGYCEVRGDQAICICKSGTTGEYCEKNVCTVNPCKNGGKCIHDDSDASNYRCTCKAGFTGLLCETEVSTSNCFPECSINENCEKVNDVYKCVKAHVHCDECVHSIRCIGNDGNAVCICDVSWSGTKCDKHIEECNELKCPEYHICRHEFVNQTIMAHCDCAPGLTGDQCTESTEATFRATSFFLHQLQGPVTRSSSSDYHLKLTFRTTLADTHIVTAENVLTEVQFALSIHHGFLYANFTGYIHRKTLPFRVNDDRWYTVVFSNLNKIVSLEMRDGDFVLSKIQMREKKSMGIYWTRIGRGRTGGFIGCVRDVYINDEYINIFESANSFGVTRGCQRSNQCVPNPCQNGGTCHDQWVDFRCDCPKPFLPPYCRQQIDEATFGHKNISSRIEFDANNNFEDVKLTTDIDLLLRTNKPNGTILYLGEKNMDEIGTYISLALLNGALNVRTRLGGKKTFSQSTPYRIDDNEAHLVALSRDSNNITVYVDGSEEANFEIENRFEHPLLADTLILGSSTDQIKDAFGTNEYFKGILQDVRVNSRVVPLTTIPNGVEKFGKKVADGNILVGTISDDICTEQNPCVNGVCKNTFNDFTCTCEKEWIGKKCDEVDHCALNLCRMNDTCINFAKGFVCTSPSTFVPSSSAIFELKKGVSASTTTSKIAFHMRTRSKSGHIILLKKSAEFLSIFLEKGYLAVKLMVNGEQTTRLTSTAVNDGSSVEVSINRSGIFINRKQSGKKTIIDFSSLLVVGNVSLIIGQIDEMYSFDGCLEDVTIGDNPPLSFFDISNAGGSLEYITHFELISNKNIISDQCYAENYCGTLNPCKNGGICHDLWNQFICECPSSFTGIFCEILIDHCEKNSCINGLCINQPTGYSCLCHSGYTGEYCDEVFDPCEEIHCLNGGNCTTQNNKFICECTPEFIGSRCQTLRMAKCSSLPCENGATCRDTIEGVQCICSPGFEGELCDFQPDYCEDIPCKNGATCMSRVNGYECLCANGYEGRICDEQKDECITMPCVHGTCRSVISDYLCTCEKGWKGPHCDMDIDECIRFPCQNNGTCINSPGSFSCACRSYYLGDLCEIPGSCVKEPCGSNGDCIQITADTHSCNCKHGFTGDACEIEIDFCAQNPCLNGANCERFTGGFRCICLPGYSGETCAVDIDDCANEVCLHGGHCKDLVNGYECDCNNTGYQGKQCEKDVDECEHGMCVNGSCTNLPGTYTCLCYTGYIGPRCNVNDPCIMDNMNRSWNDCVHGVCINPTVKIEMGHETAQYECECDPGYVGEHCIHQAEIRRPIPLSYVAGPIAALVFASAIFGCVLFGIVTIRGRRAMQGTYSPSHQEITARLPVVSIESKEVKGKNAGERYTVFEQFPEPFHLFQMNSVLKAPPEERLI